MNNKHRGWVIAIADEVLGTMRVYGPPYLTLKDAQKDAELPRLRGDRVEVWECYESDGDGGKE